MSSLGSWLKDGRTRSVLRVLALGQVISLFIAGTGAFSELLVRERSVDMPTAQTFLNYVFLSTIMLYRFATGRRTLSVPWWRYALLAVLDVEANYLVVKAYQYTHITSVMLLDCFTIPSAMLLSKLFLRVRFRWTHFVGAAICLCGLAVMVSSDWIVGRQPSSPPSPSSAPADPVRGDLLCIAGAFLYAATNVGQESLVKHHDKTEYLGMVGFFGAIVSGAQVALLERDELATVKWDALTVLLALGFVGCMFALYTLTATFLRDGDATLFNLSLLTSDVWAIVLGTVLFASPPYPLYYLALALIVAGLLVYSRQALGRSDPAAVNEERAKLKDADSMGGFGDTPAEPAAV